MLTKQEREKIAERAKESIESINVWDPYYILTGNHIPKDTSIRGDRKKMASIILALCDTSDMVELPIDKNGVPIHIGDTVWYEGNDSPVFVNYIRFSRFTSKASVEIGLGEDPDHDYGVFWCSSNEITHAKPISDYERIAQTIEEIANANHGTVTEQDLLLVAEEIRELGGSND